MTFPSGAQQGGYPGQGAPQPYQSYPGAAPSPGGGSKPSMAQILLLVVAGLGVLNLFLAFASVVGENSFYAAPYGWVPALFLLSGLTALFGILPGDQKPGAWPAIFAMSGALPFLFTVFQLEVDLEVGGVLVLIFGILQMLGAVAAYLFDAGIVSMPASPSSPYGQQNPYGQQGPYGQQSGGFAPPQQPPFGQPGQQGGQPGADASGGIPQPTAFAQPAQPQQSQQQPNPAQPQPQQTQYAPQQGQFFQQPSESGQQSGGGQAGN